MKYTFAAAVALASLASAQLDQIPQCATNCLLPPLTSDGCALTDFACHCKKPDLVGKVVPCVQTACPLPAQSSLSAGVVSICSSAGVSISIPNPGAGSTTASATTTTATSSVVTPTASVTATATGTASSTATATATGTSSSAGSSSASSSVSRSRSSVGTVSVPIGTSSAGSGTMTPFPGAAPQITQGAGLVGLMAAAAAAAIF